MLMPNAPSPAKPTTGVSGQPIFAPMIDSGQAPEGVARMGEKYRYNAADARAASERCARQIEALAVQLKAQNARGRPFFIGEQLSALDIYWVAFMYLLDLPPAPQCPVADAIRPMFELHDARIREAIDPVLFAHRDRVARACFRNPIEL